ncbi:hypothetical protein AKJ09_06806 [Labilithrix luteola]|uniref:Peptidase S1 domain-containing protein n=1 Tax=Labilithrix luteola TaxID=1391654 RepID=A0A0K1Q336_9BACT|nr:tectonin domain-containing protein [Labilithrix luteola]AKV00143.1 hypothetical protein AKJ09_06806 [Labilithrix luteola]
MWTKQFFGIAACAVAAGTTSCSDKGPSSNMEEETKSASAAIINGSIVTQNPNGIVAVYHNYSRPCTGTYLGNQWVVTAQHCVEDEGNYQGAPEVIPADLFVTTALSPGAARPSPASLQPGTYSAVSRYTTFDTKRNPSTGFYNTDVALLRLTEPLVGVTPAGRTNLSNLQGQQLACYGYGRNQLLANTPPGDATSGAGTLRSASLSVIGLASWDLDLGINLGQQMIYHGDSGGPCFLQGPGGPELVSVARNVDSNVTPTRATVVSIARDTPWSNWLDAPPRESCRSAPSIQKVRSDLASAWKNGDSTSIAMYPSNVLETTTSRVGWFEPPNQFTAGGWADSSKYAVGDFDGDGRSDVATLWEELRKGTIAVRTASGVSFTVAQWSTGQDYFRSTSQLLPGDFTGDGIDDLAIAYNDGSMTTIAVYRSFGSATAGFAAPVRWATRQQGWGDSAKWAVGDFDRDGRADIATAWNNGGNASIAIRRSIGTSPTTGYFTVEDWTPSVPGGWIDRSELLAGDFNNDGFTDLVTIWPNGGQVATAVYSSPTGAAPFGLNQWPTSGGWINDVDWAAGDFDGDGRTDLATVWNQYGQNTLTVRRSVGTSFVADPPWQYPAGTYVDSTQWCSGKFTSVDGGMVNGTGTDVGCGTRDCWSLSSQVAPSGGYYVNRWDGHAWAPAPGAGVAIDSGPNGPWLVNNAGFIFRWNGSAWTSIAGGARDISVGADGSVWIIGTTAGTSGGYEVWRWTGSAWQKMPGAGVAIDVGPSGVPWLVNSEGKIFRWDGAAWNEMGGLARDVAVGANGSVYIVSRTPRTDGDAIMKWNGAGWTEVPSNGGRRITVRPDGTLLVTTASNALRVLKP